MSSAKNFDDVWNRLFDHKIFTNSAIESFVAEFQENRRDREIVNLLNVLNVECETNNLCDYVSHTYNSVLDSLKGTLDLCLVQATRILSVDKADATRRVSQERGRNRGNEWRKFQENLQVKFMEADNQFEAQLEEVKKFYENKELGLNFK